MYRTLRNKGIKVKRVDMLRFNATMPNGDIWRVTRDHMPLSRCFGRGGIILTPTSRVYTDDILRTFAERMVFDWPDYQPPYKQPQRNRKRNMVNLLIKVTANPSVTGSDLAKAQRNLCVGIDYETMDEFADTWMGDTADERVGFLWSLLRYAKDNNLWVSDDALNMAHIYIVGVVAMR